jgi:hypothetical protein
MKTEANIQKILIEFQLDEIRESKVKMKKY